MSNPIPEPTDTPPGMQPFVRGVQSKFSEMEAKEKAAQSERNASDKGLAATMSKMAENVKFLINQTKWDRKDPSAWGDVLPATNSNTLVRKAFLSDYDPIVVHNSGKDGLIQVNASARVATTTPRHYAGYILDVYILDVPNGRFFDSSYFATGLSAFPTTTVGGIHTSLSRSFIFSLPPEKDISVYMRRVYYNTNGDQTSNVTWWDPVLSVSQIQRG